MFKNLIIKIKVLRDLRNIKRQGMLPLDLSAADWSPEWEVIPCVRGFRVRQFVGKSEACEYAGFLRQHLAVPAILRRVKGGRL